MSDPEVASQRGRIQPSALPMFLKSTEYWVVVGRGSLAFRFGPFKPDEIGPILKTGTNAT